MATPTTSNIAYYRVVTAQESAIKMNISKQHQSKTQKKYMQCLLLGKLYIFSYYLVNVYNADSFPFPKGGFLFLAINVSIQHSAADSWHTSPWIFTYHLPINYLLSKSITCKLPIVQLIRHVTSAPTTGAAHDITLAALLHHIFILKTKNMFYYLWYDIY